MHHKVCELDKCLGQLACSLLRVNVTIVQNIGSINTILEVIKQTIRTGCLVLKPSNSSGKMEIAPWWFVCWMDEVGNFYLQAQSVYLTNSRGNWKINTFTRDKNYKMLEDARLLLTKNVPLFVKIKLKNIQMTKILTHRLDPDSRFIPLLYDFCVGPAFSRKLVCQGWPCEKSCLVLCQDWGAHY